MIQACLEMINKKNAQCIQFGDEYLKSSSLMYTPFEARKKYLDILIKEKFNSVVLESNYQKTGIF